MKNKLIMATAFSIIAILSSQALAIPVITTKLTGLTGGSPQGTAVYMADLNSIALSNILSISIEDVSGGFGGAAGQFSGFDLDAIILSNALCTTAACVAGLTGLSVFDYSVTGTIFNEGTQRPSIDAKLFGTDAGGSDVDNLIATLGAFDANSTTVIPGADGFLSMGDFGELTFNLSSSVSTAGLYMYFGEVGDNGEVAGSSITVSDTHINVPEPSIIALFGAGLLGLGFARRRRD